MHEQARIAVIVPAYNEERLIVATLRSVPRLVDQVFVIDDGSRDATAAAAESLGDPRVRVVRHERNLGVGAALWTGYRSAFDHGADIAVVMAGDNQMDPEDLPALVAPLIDDHADYVKGDRLAHASVFRRMPPTRLLGNHVLSLLTRVCTGLPVSDSQCGYTALHRRAYARLAERTLWSGYGYPNDLLGWLACERLRVRDVTVRPIYADEQSGVRLRHALVVVPYVLLRVLWRRMTLRTSAARALRQHTMPVSVVLPPGER